MKQVLQNLKNGRTEVADVPCPRPGRGQLLIRTTHTLVSAGTERMLVDFGKANLIDKARQQPDKVRMVLDKVRTDGLLPTIEAIRNKLDQMVAMGYCNVGEVVEIGPGVSGFEVGDRVASNGKHAEMVTVPVNLCARVPDGVGDEEAAFTVLGAIALQGIRLVQPTLGEAVVVTGLGLIGLMTIQLLRAQGCRVLGLDLDPQKLALAERLGAEVVDLGGAADPVAAAMTFSRGRGVDAVIITASTRSNEPVHQAALMSRKRGRIVLVGVTGLELSRADFYEKELTFQVSCSYGPGRYDPQYEEQGSDYPIGFVRWTEQRNFEAVLDMMADRRLDLAPLISHRFPIDAAKAAYAVVGGSEPSLGIVLQYPARDGADIAARQARTVLLPPATAPLVADAPRVSMIGAGNYTGGVLIPAFKAAGVRLVRIASTAGVSGVHFGRKFGFAEATTDTDALLADTGTDVVVIGTRHDTHAEFVLRAMAAGKHVFVEKPLALTNEELDRIEAAAASGFSGLLMVGFNRRFSPLTEAMMSQLSAGPKSVSITINAGAIPSSHWTQDLLIGGGRIIGEACHFIDLARHIINAPISEVRSRTMGVPDGRSNCGDTRVVTLSFADGSIANINYFANGHKSFPKERVEVFDGGRVFAIDNFTRLSVHGAKGGRRLLRQDKGQNNMARAFVAAVRAGGAAPISLAELIEVSRASIAAAASA